MRSLNIHIFRHTRFEGPAVIKDWAESNNHSLAYTYLNNADPLPKLRDFDLLIVMGGPMSVHDEKIFPWLKEEKIFIRKAIDSGKTVIGICLGAQIIAEIMGGEVVTCKNKEIGWFPIILTKDGQQNSLFSHLPESLIVFHWHGETFSLPAKAKLIASSEANANQVFTIGKNVVGLQCHFEITPDSIKLMAEKGSEELIVSDYVMAGDEIIQNSIHSDNLNKYLFEILDRVAESVLN